MDEFTLGCKNFIFLGEAGCGKSEVATSFAVALAALNEKKVHFFDMDMTKPLFRSRDVRERLEEKGIAFHYQAQFMDAPTLVGGVSVEFRDPNSYVVMDVGGDYIGARAIGGYSELLNRDDSLPFYVINSYRPWSDTIDHIDETLGKIIGMSHVELGKLRMVSNPNNGLTTTKEEFLEGHKHIVETLKPYAEVQFACVRDGLYDAVVDQIDVPVFPVELRLTYEWLLGDDGKV